MIPNCDHFWETSNMGADLFHSAYQIVRENLYNVVFSIALKNLCEKECL